jgi:hypothetical protein
MRAADLFRQYRKTINPPYSTRNLFIIFVTLFILIALPLTVLSVREARSPRSKAQTPKTQSKLEVLKKQTLAALNLNQKLEKSTDKKKTKKDLLSLVKQRKQSSLALIEEDSVSFLRIALSPKLRALFPKKEQENIEKYTTLEGEIEHLIADDFEREVAKKLYFLNTNAGKRLSLYFADEGPDLLSGSKVKVKGFVLGKKVAVAKSSGKDFQIISEKTKVLPTATTKKVAIVMLNFQNDSSQPFSAEKVRRITFTATLQDPENNSGSVKAFYKENSFGFLDIESRDRVDGDVYGWYRVPYNNNPCSYTSWSSAARAAAQADGVDFTGYTNVIYTFPTTTACLWGGMAMVGGGTSWVNGAYSRNSALELVGHELGHNFGLRHSSSYYDCTDQNGQPTPISGNCKTSEYGDQFDMMGITTGPFGTRHMNNFKKGRLGWYTPANTQTVATNGTYTVAPIGEASTGVQALRIQRDSILYWYLEYRQPFGFDEWDPADPVVNGVTIRLAPGYSTRSRSYLIDTTPDTRGNNDQPLTIDKTFHDPVKNVSVKTVSANSQAATVEITFGGAVCARANPTISIDPASQWGAAGETLSYNVTVVNNDSSDCSSSTFNVTSSLSSGFTMNPASYSQSIAPGASSTRSADVTSEVGTQNGAYPFSLTATNSSDATYSATTSANYNVFTPDIEDPSVAVTSPTDGSTVSGTTNITATASDNVGVTKVEFYIDSNLKSTDLSSPYVYSWDTTTETNESHTLVAKAYDAANNVSTSTAITVSVDNQQGKTGDLNGDGVVNIFDLSILLSNWGTSNQNADLNNDGVVNIFDLSILLSNWGS